MRPLARLVRRAVLVVVLALAVAALDGCTSAVDDSDTGDSATAPTTEPEPSADLRVVTRLTRLAGTLPPERRERVVEVTRGIVEKYVESAFLEGERRPAFEGFTAGARRIALHDRATLTLDTGKDAEVTPQRVAAYLAVLAPHGRVVGATARLEVDVRVKDATGTHQVHLGGRLLLTPTPQGLQVFGYDLQRSGKGAS